MLCTYLSTSEIQALATLSSRQFNQDASKAKKAARQGPVFITDRGRPAHVLLTIEDYHRLIGQASTSIVDLIGLDREVDDLPALPPRELYRPADFS